MFEKLKVKVSWLQKAAICLAFFGFLSARDALGYGLPPLITVPPLGVAVQSGDTITLTTTIGVSLTPLTIKWYCNSNSINSMKNATVVTTSVLILGTTVSTLTITNATAAQAGNYYIKAENGGGEITSPNALVIVLVPDLSSTLAILPAQCGKTNNGFHLGLLKPSKSNCVIEASSDYVHWTPIATNGSSQTNISYLDNSATNYPQRFYRLRLQ